jgi:hypothetical protein
MCNLEDVSKFEGVDGYKLVAINECNKKYYSLAMGFCYQNPDMAVHRDDFINSPQYYKIPEMKEQERISSSFIYGLFNHKDPAFRNEMTGRTAIFLDVNRAVVKAIDTLRSDIKLGFRLAIVRARVAKDIMFGSYSHSIVAAGRLIAFKEYHIYPFTSLFANVYHPFSR